MTDIHLEWRDSSDLKANPKNWRRHPQAQVRAMKDVLDDVGWAGALLYNERTGHLIDGHLRQAISKGQVPVLVGEWSEEEERKILLTLDPLAYMAEHDQDMLLGLLEDTRFDSDAINAMMEAIVNGETSPMPPLHEPKEDPGPQIDRAEELRQKWGTERGQLWAVGEHALLCGDATNKEDVHKLLWGRAVPQLMVTDPPYGVNYDPAWRNEAAAKGQLAYAASRIGEVANDDRVDWSDAYNLFPGDVAYTWSPPGDHVIITGTALQFAGFEIRNQIMWRKPHFPISRGHYTYQHEPCWYGVRKGRISHWVGDANASTVWEIALDKNVEGGHSTQKPLECMARPIRNHEGNVYDPFLGSGTTMVAAEQLNRICYGMEIEPKYVAVTLERMAGMGLEPRLVNG